MKVAAIPKKKIQNPLKLVIMSPEKHRWPTGIAICFMFWQIIYIGKEEKSCEIHGPLAILNLFLTP